MEMLGKEDAVILADGSFPSHEIPLGVLNDSGRIICCDGSAATLLNYGLVPFAIVGDCDSLTEDIAEKYKDRIFRSADQETNDLTKAVEWSVSRGLKKLIIVGATGKREDHTLGNISLLAEYARKAEVEIITDTGLIIPVLRPGSFESFPGQQVSIFSINPVSPVTSAGLRYPLENRRLSNWWEGTLNEATGSEFSIDFEGGPVILYLKFP